MLVYNVQIERDVVDFESITVTSGAVIGLTAAKLRPTSGRNRAGATIYFQSNAVRVRYDPLSANLTSADGANAGPVFEAGGSLLIRGHNNMSQFRTIATGADGVLKVFYHD